MQVIVQLFMFSFLLFFFFFFLQYSAKKEIPDHLFIHWNLKSYLLIFCCCCCLFLDFSMKVGNLDANCGHTWHKHKNNVYSGLLVSCRENFTSRGSTFGRSLLVPSPDLPLRPHFSPQRWLAWPQVSCSNTRAHLQSNSLQLLPG